MKDILTLTTDGCDRATAYRMSNKVVRRDDGLYVTWLDAHFRVMVARVDAESGSFDTPFPLAQGYDNHCGAAMAETPDGKLHVMAGGHGMAFVHRFSETPVDPGCWSLPEVVGITATYPSLVCGLDGTLHLAQRSSAIHGPGGMRICQRPLGGTWSWPYILVTAPAPGYCYTLNALAVGPDGVLHLVVEFYRTYPENRHPPHSAAVAHLESPDGAQTWYHTDGREVKHAPVALEDTQPVRLRGGGNLRPGNVTVLPDGRPVFSIWDEHAGTLELALRDEDRIWRFTDLTPHLQLFGPKSKANDAPQLAVDREGQLVAVCAVAPESRWVHPETRQMILWLDPRTGRMVRRAEIPQLTPGAPDWSPSIEKGHIGLPDGDLWMLYTSGNRGRCATTEGPFEVRLMRIPT